MSPIQNQLRRVFNERCCPLKQANKQMKLAHSQLLPSAITKRNKQTNKQTNKQKTPNFRKMREYWAAMQIVYYHATLSNLFGWAWQANILSHAHSLPPYLFTQTLWTYLSSDFLTIRRWQAIIINSDMFLFSRIGSFPLIYGNTQVFILFSICIRR